MSPVTFDIYAAADLDLGADGVGHCPAWPAWLYVGCDCEAEG